MKDLTKCTHITLFTMRQNTDHVVVDNEKQLSQRNLMYNHEIRNPSPLVGEVI